MKNFFCLLFCFACCLSSQTLHIVSDEIFFDGEDVHLKGHIKITSQQGTISSNRATLSSKDKASYICTFQDNVQTSLPDAVIQSDSATFIYPDYHIYYSANDASLSQMQATLLYKKNNIPFSASSKKMFFALRKKKTDDVFPIHSCSLTDNVHICVDADKQLKAHEVCFSPSVEEKDMIFFHQKDDMHPCKIFDSHNFLMCKTGHIDLNEQELFLEKAKGQNRSSALEKKYHFDFSTQKLFYEHRTSKLVMKENVHIDFPDFALMHTDELHIYENRRVKEKQLKKICALGSTSIFFPNKTSSLHSHLICQGSLIVDNELKTITANASHHTEKKHPLIYNDDQITFHGKKAFFQYQQKENYYIPEYIKLEDGVAFHTKTFPIKNTYGIAECVYYDPRSKFLKLSAKPDQRVLFWHAEKSLKLSAPEIHIKKTEDQKEYIQGIGNVRFSFDFDEKKFFSEMFATAKDTYEE